MLKNDEIKEIDTLVDKVVNVTSDFTMPYDDSADTEHTQDSFAYRYACLLDELNLFVSNLVDELKKN